MEIRQILPQLYLILPTFGQVYLWREEQELTLVDSGVPGSGAEIAKAFAELGFRRQQLRRIVLTHCHEDHAGAAAEMRGWANVEVLVHRLDAPVVRGERPYSAPMLTERERPFYENVASPTRMVPACGVDTELADGDLIDFGGGAHVIETPGHTEGSIAIWLPENAVLFTGDLMANPNGSVILGPFNVERSEARDSFIRLTGLPAQTICFGHGDVLTGASGAQRWSDLREDCREGSQGVPDPLG